MKKCFSTIYRQVGQWSSLKWPCLAVVLGAGIIVPLARGTTASAAIPCQSDPVVTLSNGDVLDLSAVVDDSTDDVQQVSYTLHAPVGTSVTSEVDTSALGPKDTFQFYADEPAGTYRAGTKVTTLTPQISVAATTDLVSLLSLNGKVLSTASTSGQSPQTLWMNVSG